MQSEQFQLHAQIEDRHWWFVARRRILHEIVRKLAPPRGGQLQPRPNPLPKREGESVVVDIGCGTGANLAALADEYRCVGIDTSAEAIALAQRRFPGITFLCGSAPGDVAQWLRQASVVLLTDVLEHVADDRGLLASIVRACSPGCQFIVTVPADMRLWSPHDEAFGHFRRYDPENFAAVWAELPIKTRLISHFNSRLYPLVRWVRSINRRRGRTGGAANTDFKLPPRYANAALEAYFAGERRRLLRAIDCGGGYRQGVSLIAVLEREADPKQNATNLANILGQGLSFSGGSPAGVASIIPTPSAL